MNEIEAIVVLDSIRFIYLPQERRAEMCEALKIAMQALREKQEREENEPLTRCENCTHWDKSITLMSAHACAYWSPSKKEPRYTEWFEFCSFASAKPERSEGP